MNAPENLLRIGNTEKILQNLDAHADIVDFFPKEMDIEITSFCNYRCSMCPHSLIGNQLAAHMSFEQLQMLSEMFPYCKRIMIQGDGEPLMHPEFLKITEYIRSFGCLLCTTTNLSLLNEETAEALAQDYELVTVSCDAGSAETYELIRKGGDFTLFSKNLDLLMRKSDPDRIVINAVVMRQNIAELKDMLYYLHAHGIRRVIFSNLLTTAYLKNLSDSVSFLGDAGVNYLKECEAIARELGIQLMINWDYQRMQSDKPQAFSSYETILSESEKQTFINAYQKLHTVQQNYNVGGGTYHCQGICRNLYEKTYIDVNGNILLCCFGKLQPVGNIFQQSFEAIWNGAVYRDCRRQFFSGDLPNFCIGCRYAVTAQYHPMQAHEFRITDMDEQFFSDEIFWQNR